MSQLYLVRADNQDGENADLFVSAETAQEAFAMWRGYCQDQEWEVPEDPMWACVIFHDNTVPGPIPWETMNREYP